MDHVHQVIEDLKSFSNPMMLEGMARFGIDTSSAFGINIPTLRNYAKKFSKDHELAVDLWNTGIHEARILCAFVDDYKLVTEKQMDAWVLDFNSWDLCDQVCGNLFDKTEFMKTKALEWVYRNEEFVKRAGFTLMATSAVHRKKEENMWFYVFFDEILRHSDDDRNFVKKAINWALRQLGKRNLELNELAIECAEKLLVKNTKSSRWIAQDALRELQSDSVLNRLRQKTKK